MKKVIYIFMFFSILTLFFVNYSYAVENSDLQIINKIKVAVPTQQIIDSGGGAISSSSEFGVDNLKGTTSAGSSEIKNIGNNLIQILSTVASIVSVLVLIILGIKYMFGSIEEKVEYKKTLLPYVIGAALVFAASSIAGIIYSIAIQI